MLAWTDWHSLPGLILQQDMLIIVKPSFHHHLVIPMLCHVSIMGSWFFIVWQKSAGERVCKDPEMFER